MDWNIYRCQRFLERCIHRPTLQDDSYQTEDLCTPDEHQDPQKCQIQASTMKKNKYMTPVDTNFLLKKFIFVPIHAPFSKLQAYSAFCKQLKLKSAGP